MKGNFRILVQFGTFMTDENKRGTLSFSKLEHLQLTIFYMNENKLCIE